MMFAVPIAQPVQELGYGLNYRAVEVQFPACFCSTPFPAHPAPEPNGYRVPFPLGVKWNEHEARYSLPSSDGVKNK
jgi:hypothetical protein